LTEQGSPPRRSARQPDPGRRGYDRPAAERPVAERPVAERPVADRARAERPRAERPRPDRTRAERPRADRPRRVQGQGRPPGWDQDAFEPDTDTELPPWAGPSIQPARPGGTRLRRPAPAGDYDPDEQVDAWEGDERPEWPDEPVPVSPPPGQPQRSRRAGRRAAAARLRKSRRRVLRWCGIAIVVCVVAAVTAMFLTHKNTPKLPYVTTLLHGEFKSVPDTCTALSPAAIGQYLPGSHSTVQSQATATESECSFTVDGNRNFMILTLGAQSYQPFAAATGNGSASQNALDNFAADRVLLASPPKHSAVPKATIEPLTGIGQHAFLAIQIEHTGGIARDVATVTVLDRNDVLTVSMSAQENRGFGPVAISTLQGDARAVAGALVKKALAQPTA
jgi:hypothetical protein